MAKFLLSFALAALLAVSAYAAREAPEGACAPGCDEGFVCRVDKAAGCDKTAISTDVSCWACTEAAVKPTRAAGEEGKKAAKKAKKAEKAEKGEKKGGKRAGKKAGRKAANDADNE